MDDAALAALTKSSATLQALQALEGTQASDEQFLHLVQEFAEQIKPMLEDLTLSAALAQKQLGSLRFYIQQRKQRCCAAASDSDFKVLALTVLDQFVGALAAMCEKPKAPLRGAELQAGGVQRQGWVGNGVQNAFDEFGVPIAEFQQASAAPPLEQADLLGAQDQFDYIFNSRGMPERSQNPQWPAQLVSDRPVAGQALHASDFQAIGTTKEPGFPPKSDIMPRLAREGGEAPCCAEKAIQTATDAQDDLDDLAAEVRQQSLACGAARNSVMQQCRREFYQFGQFMAQELSKVGRAVCSCRFGQKMLEREMQEFQRITVAECGNILAETKIAKNFLAGSMRCAQAQFQTLGGEAQRLLQMSALQRERCQAVATGLQLSEALLLQKTDQLLNQARLALFCLHKENQKSGELMRRLDCRQRQLFECLPGASLLAATIAISRNAAFLVKGDAALDIIGQRCQDIAEATKGYRETSENLDRSSAAVVRDAIHGAELKSARLVEGYQQNIAELRKETEGNALVEQNRALRIQLLQAQAQAEEADELQRLVSELQGERASARDYAAGLEAQIAQMRQQVTDMRVQHECLNSQLSGLYPELFAASSDRVLQVERQVQLCTDFEDAIRVRTESAAECAFYSAICDNDRRFLRKSESRLALARKVQSKLARENQRLAAALERCGCDKEQLQELLQLR